MHHPLALCRQGSTPAASRWLLVLSALFACLLIALLPASARAATVEDCKALAAADLSAVPDAPTEILATGAVAASQYIPAYCRIEGYVAPQVSIEFHLPLENWNGKFVLQGCGGLCGYMQSIASCDEAVARGFACGSTDMGHKGHSGSGKWAYNNPVAEIDFGHRATHVATLAGKAIVRKFYAADPRYSYFFGCSTGGRQGLVEAQRYPLDFDGIVSGSPILYTYTGPLQAYWMSTANLDRDGNEIMSMAKLKLLHQSVIKACDGLDGVKDGMLADPRMCRFDVKTLACRAGAKGECLNDGDLAVVRKFYDGPSNSKGPIGTDGSAPFGSEMNWAASFSGAGTKAPFYRFSQDYLRYLAFPIDPGPSYRLIDFDWDKDPQRLNYSLLSAGNPDLRLFSANGGKLILFHGGAEPRQAQTLDYYNMATRIAGGREEAQSFARMFLLPGFGHCVGPDGINFADMLGALDQWVAGGKAPDSIMGYAVKPQTNWQGKSGPGIAIGPGLAPAGFDGTNIRNAAPMMARPLFPFPYKAVYKGGDPDDAASYRRELGSDSSR